MSSMFLGLFLLLGVELHSIMLDTGAYPCNGSIVTVEWVNPGPRVVQIVQTSHWIGAYYGTRADVGTLAYVQQVGGERIEAGYFAWDRYAEPTGPHQVTFSFAPHYIRVNPLDSVVFLSGCSSPTSTFAHAALRVWFTYE